MALPFVIFCRCVSEFLNADDEAEPVEEEDNDMRTAEEDRFIDNSGWSSRTR